MRIDNVWSVQIEPTEGCTRMCNFCIGYYKPHYSRKPVVQTLKGKKYIWDVKKGEKIVTLSNDGTLVTTEVKKIFEREVDEFLLIKFENNLKLCVTLEHPFFVKGNWVEAKTLMKGDEVYNVPWQEYQSFVKGEENKIRNKTVKQRDAVRKYMMERNPMKHREVVEKVVRTNKKLGNYERNMRELWKRGVFDVSPIEKLKNSNPEKYNELCSKRSLRMRQNNPMHNEQVAKKVSETMLKKIDNGEIVPWFSTKEGRITISRIARIRALKNNPMKDPLIAIKNAKSHGDKPTPLEVRVINLIKRYSLPIKYVGDYKLWIGSKKYRFRNPDFILETDKNKIIELYDSRFPKRDHVIWKREREEHYTRFGKKCLFLDIKEKTNRDVLADLREFISNGIKITSIKYIKNKKIKTWNFHCEPFNSYLVNYLWVHNCGIWSIWKEQKDRIHKFMTVDIAEKIAKELNEWLKLCRVEFALQGEPLLNPHMSEIIKTFRKNFPKSQLLITTNGDMLKKNNTINKEKITELFQSGLNYLLIDIYDNNYIWWKTELEKSVSLPIFEFYKGFNVYTYRGFKNSAIVLMENIIERKNENKRRILNNQAGNIDSEKIKALNLPDEFFDVPIKYRCSNVFHELCIKYDGSVVSCCMNWKRELIMGKFPEESLKNIWNSFKFNCLRQLLFNKERVIPPCNRCNYKGYKTGLLKDLGITLSTEELIEKLEVKI